MWRINAKRMAAEKAAEYVQDGMTIGLGTGSTAVWMIRRLGERVAEGLRIRGIPTSKATAELAGSLGIPLVSFDQLTELDLTIDGADEISPDLDLIKGGGGALLREKLVAAASRQLIIIADESKRVSALGAFGVPVEVVPFAWELTARRIAELGGRPELRRSTAAPFVTENSNYILDCDFGLIREAGQLERELKLLTGVVESGLFVGMADIVLLGSEQGVAVIECDR